MTMACNETVQACLWMQMFVLMLVENPNRFTLPKKKKADQSGESLAF